VIKLGRSEITKEDQILIQQWLKKNKPKICPPGQRTDPDKINNKWGWGKKKKKES
jgi:hypothetical protein